MMTTTETKTETKKTAGTPDRALEKAAALSTAKAEVSWLRNSQGKALMTNVAINGMLITADDNTRLIAALINTIAEFTDTVAELTARIAELTA